MNADGLFFKRTLFGYETRWVFQENTKDVWIKQTVYNTDGTTTQEDCVVITLDDLQEALKRLRDKVDATHS